MPSLNAQQHDIDSIKQNQLYYWGEFTSLNRREAEEKALGELSRQIVVRIQTTTLTEKSEQNKGVKTNFNDIVKSYSSATLRNVKTLGLPPEKGKFYVLRYIEKAEVERIFNERRNLIINMYERSLDFSDQGNYEQAIKLCYHSLILLQSLPNGSVLWNGKELSVALPEQINALVRVIRFETVSDTKISEKDREIQVIALSGQKPIKELSASYWDGGDQISIRFVDGKATIRLLGSSVLLSKIKFTVNTQFYENRQEIKEVAELWDFVDKPLIDAEKELDLTNRDLRNAPPSKSESLTESIFKPSLIKKADQRWLFPAIRDESKDWDSFELQNLAEIVQLQALWLEKNIPRDSSDAFLHQKLKGIKYYNKLSIYVDQEPLTLHRTWDAHEVRSLKAINRYKRIKLETPEVLVFDANTTNGVTDVNFGVYPSLYSQVATSAQNDEDWNRRQVILKFMERYRTGFLTRDADFISKMFSDDAMVIVGRILRPGDSSNPHRYAPETVQQPDVEYLRMTKLEYLERQKRLFKENEDMFLGFSTFTIRGKNNQPGVYGISLRQNYQADTYADEGHLFLLVDFNGKEPQIYVRAWQPNEWSEDMLIGLSNFRVIK